MQKFMMSLAATAATLAASVMSPVSAQQQSSSTPEGSSPFDDLSVSPNYCYRWVRFGDALMAVVNERGADPDPDKHIPIYLVQHLLITNANSMIAGPIVYDNAQTSQAFKAAVLDVVGRLEKIESDSDQRYATWYKDLDTANNIRNSVQRNKQLDSIQEKFDESLARSRPTNRPNLWCIICIDPSCFRTNLQQRICERTNTARSRQRASCRQSIGRLSYYKKLASREI